MSSKDSKALPVLDSMIRPSAPTSIFFSGAPAPPAGAAAATARHRAKRKYRNFGSETGSRDSQSRQRWCSGRKKITLPRNCQQINNSQSTRELVAANRSSQRRRQRWAATTKGQRGQTNVCRTSSSKRNWSRCLRVNFAYKASGPTPRRRKQLRGKHEKARRKSQFSQTSGDCLRCPNIETAALPGLARRMQAKPSNISKGGTASKKSGPDHAPSAILN